jgi:hypothetical protein
MVDAQMSLVGRPEILEELKQLSRFHRVPNLAFQNVLHRLVNGDDVPRSHQQATTLQGRLFLRVPDDCFQNRLLNLNRRHKNERPTPRRLALTTPKRSDQTPPQADRLRKS